MTDPISPRWDFLPPEPGDDGGLTEQRFQALIAAWIPPGAVGSVEKARAIFVNLKAADQIASLEALPRVRHGWKIAGRSLSETVTVATYLANREWERFPKPVKPDGNPDVPRAPFAPFSRGTWALFRRALEGGRSVDVSLGWIRKGVTIPLATAPSQAEEGALVPVAVGSPEFTAWAEYGERLGFVLPKPDATKFVFLPATMPPPLSLRWKGYRLPGLATVRIRSERWWWRLYSEGAPVSELVTRARRAEGVDQVETGPLPLSREIAAMVEVRNLTDRWEAWANWFALQGAHLELWPHGSIWCPSEYPPATMSRARESAGAAA